MKLDMRRMGVIACSVVILACISTVDAQVIIQTLADLNTDVLDVQDPNSPNHNPLATTFGPWSYGFGPDNASTVSPLGFVAAQYDSNVSGTTVEVFIDQNFTVEQFPGGIAYNDWTTDLGVGIDPGLHMLVIGAAIHPAKVRWTATATVPVNISGVFTGGNLADVLVSLIHNDADIVFSQVGSGTTDVVFDINMNVTAGDTIDFALREASNFGISHTGLGVVISEIDAVPGPTCIQQGVFFTSDLNKDCFVNILDFAMLALDWLKCNDPETPACTDVP